MLPLPMCCEVAPVMQLPTQLFLVQKEARDNTHKAHNVHKVHTLPMQNEVVPLVCMHDHRFPLQAVECIVGS